MKVRVRQRLSDEGFVVPVDARARPAVVRPEGTDAPTVSLNWDRCLDDEQRLRACPVCGGELYRRRGVPSLIIPALVLLAAAVGLTLYGSPWAWAVWAAMLATTAVEVVLRVRGARVAGCYGCGSEYEQATLATSVAWWSRARADALALDRPRPTAPADAPNPPRSA